MNEPDVHQVLRHRMRSHIAALRAAASLGSPQILAAQVYATRVRLAECRAIMEELETQHRPASSREGD